MEHVTNSPEETEALGEALAGRLTPGTVIAFTGDLGAGKTAFVRGLARGGVCAVEWSENVSDALDGDCLRVDIRRGGDDSQRIITVGGGRLD